MNQPDFASMKQAPRNVLLLKGHSAGIGDILRSSAAWRALRNSFPAARLHLWLHTREPGYPSEQLIRHHHLLSSFCVSDKRTRTPLDWWRLLREARQISRHTCPDLIIDCEPNGFRTTLLTWLMRRWTRALSVGIGQVPLRGSLYNRVAPSFKAYAAGRHLTLPLEYTERDFVALAALGIERRGVAIELKETHEAHAFREHLCVELGACRATRLLGLNIGCGTPGAGPRRPDLYFLTALVGELQRRHQFALVLTGAPNEREINREFLSRFGANGPVLDIAGRTTILELAGAIKACSLFISGDTGPYHMAVALRVPTLALFTAHNPQAYHHHEWVECQLALGSQHLAPAFAAAERLLQRVPPGLP